MSERTVPRRESPWGMPEGDHRQPKPHRCNDRAEDVIQVRITKIKSFLKPLISMYVPFLQLSVWY